jgi:purine nucleosidase
MIRIVLDTDTAGDDTTAMTMALRSREARLEAVTINCGNVGFDQEVENALYTIEAAGMSGKVPVFPGARRPLLRDWETAERVHGDDGMGNSRFPRARQRPESKHAVDALTEIVGSQPGEITLVEIAPMTNLALAIRKDPSFAKNVKHLYFMGGTNQYLGNVTPAAEFNMWVDPEAAKIVFDSGIPMTMVGWEICMRHAILTGPEVDRVAELDTKEGRFFTSVNGHVREFMKKVEGVDGVSCPDTITIAIVLNEKVATDVRPKRVDVDAESELSRGATYVDHLGVTGKKPNMDVVYSASGPLFKEMLFRMLNGETV